MMSTDSDQRVETWKPIPGFSAYEASDNSVWRLVDGKPIQVSGGIRSVDRMSGRRQLKGVLLKGRMNNSGYVLVNVTNDEGRPVTVTAHKLILLAHVGECPPGQETLHDPQRGPLWCRVPEDMRYGTKEENAADIKAAGTGRRPATHPCVNHSRCGGMVVSKGSRCLPCAQEVGVHAGWMLRAGLGLKDATRRVGYKNEEWVHTLAARHGGWTGTLAQARAQRPSWSRRVVITFCDKIWRAWR